jgi:ketosteroid isomerase-like protein
MEPETKMTQQDNITTLQAAWAALGEGKFDELAAMYADDMTFVLPGQTDLLTGRENFRTALDNIGAALPPGFEVKDLRYFPGDDEIVNIVEWTASSMPAGSQSAILWKFDAAGKITEERWYIDTEQWKSCF